MEITNFQQYSNWNNLKLQKQNVFDFLKKKELKKQYDAQRYQKNKEQLKRTRDIQKNFQALGLSKPKLVSGVFGGELTTPLTRKERNHKYYLKRINAFRKLRQSGKVFASYAHTHTTNQRKINNRKKGQKLRQSGKNAINNKLLNKRTIHEFKKMISEKLRVATKGKKPIKLNWPTRLEKKKLETLLKKYGSYGVKAGVPVEYAGRVYAGLYCFDSDQKKENLNVPIEIQEEISRVNKELCQRLGISYNESGNGQNFYFLSKEPLPKIILTYKGYKCAEIIGKGQQFIFEGNGKVWHENKKPVKIIKNVWGFCQIINRKWNEWQAIEKSRLKINKKQPTNIKVYKPLETTQENKQLFNQYQENEKMIIKTKLLNYFELNRKNAEQWSRITAEPCKAWMSGISFFFDAYYDNQEELKNYVGKIVKLELKRGTKYFHLDRILSSYES